MTSPASLLARLEELKKWQQQQQARLMKEHARKLQDTERNYSSASCSDYDTIEGLSEYDSPKIKSPPSRFIQQQNNERNKEEENEEAESLSLSKSPNFGLPNAEVYRARISGEFTERAANLNLYNHNKDRDDEDRVPKKPKQPFLRRGAGLVRFNMRPGDQNRATIPVSFRKSKFHKYVLEEENRKKSEDLEDRKDEKPLMKNSSSRNSTEKRLSSVQQKNPVPSIQNTKKQQTKITAQQHNKINSSMPSDNNNKYTNKAATSTSISITSSNLDISNYFSHSHSNSNAKNQREVNSPSTQEYLLSNLSKNTKYEQEEREQGEEFYLAKDTLCLGKKLTPKKSPNINTYPEDEKEEEENDLRGITPLIKKPLEPMWNSRRVLSYEPTHSVIKKAINEEIRRSLENAASAASAAASTNIAANSSIAADVYDDDDDDDDIKNREEDEEETKTDDVMEKPRFTSDEISRNLLKQISEVALKTFGPVQKRSEQNLPPPQTTTNQPIFATPKISFNNVVEKTPGEQTMYERALEKDLMAFEALEKKVLNSSFCSTNSSVVRLLSSTPQKENKNKSLKTILAPSKEECSNSSLNSSITSEDFSEENTTQRDFQDSKQWSDINSNSNSNSNSKEEDTEDGSSVNSSFISTRIDETLKPKTLRNSSVQTSPSSSSKLTKENVNNSVNLDNALQAKLKELDLEINSLRKQNAEVANLKDSLEKQQRDFLRERKKMENELEDERIRIEFFLEDEKKKLAKEKMVFERYTKDLQNKPNRKEREEISNLKMELANLKETLKLKEAKSGTCQARLRTQVKALEKENSALKDEVEKLNKVNARLIANQKYSKPKNSDTKILHEINKNISKLTTQKKEGQKAHNSRDKSSSRGSVEKRSVSVGRSSKGNIYSESESDSDENEEGRCDDEDEQEQQGEGEESDDSLKQHFKNMKFDVNTNSKKEAKAKSRVHTITNSSKNNFKSNTKEEESDKNKNIELNQFFDKQAKLIADKKYIAKKMAIEGSKSNKSINSNNEIDENDRNLTNLQQHQQIINQSNERLSSMSSFKTVGGDISESYEKAFGHFDVTQKNSSAALDNSLKKDRSETILADGRKEIKYSNGNVKLVSPDGNHILMKYFNGDLKETKLLEGTVKYFYEETKTWHTTYADGTELLEFASGQTEKKYNDGRLEIKFPNGITRMINGDKSEVLTYPDGMIVNINSNGEKTLHLPNGQKEIHTSDHKRREYPDGTVKILYPNGSSETRYANGRIRVKDKDGNLLMDSMNQEN